MITGKELLTELRGNLIRDVSDAVSGESDTLWTDDSLYLYLNEGYNKFCRETGILIDASDDTYTLVTLASGQDVYPISDKVVNVLSATFGTREVSISGRAALTNATVFQFASGGEPNAIALDEETRTLRVFPKPGDLQDGAVLRLRVVRLPKKPISKANASVALEIPDDFALGVVEWAAYRALRNHDADVENMAKADKHKSSFSEYVDDAKLSVRKGRRRVQFTFGG